MPLRTAHQSLTAVAVVVEVFEAVEVVTTTTDPTETETTGIEITATRTGKHDEKKTERVDSEIIETDGITTTAVVVETDETVTGTTIEIVDDHLDHEIVMEMVYQRSNHRKHQLHQQIRWRRHRQMEALRVRALVYQRENEKRTQRLKLRRSRLMKLHRNFSEERG